MDQCGSSGKDYQHTGSGENLQGNHWCSYEGKNGSNAYHYYNGNGSYYQKNTDGSALYDSGRGYGWTQPATKASGQATKGSSKK